MDPRYPVVFGACVMQFTTVGLLFSFGLFFDVRGIVLSTDSSVLSSRGLDDRSLWAPRQPTRRPPQDT